MDEFSQVHVIRLEKINIKDFVYEHGEKMFLKSVLKCGAFTGILAIGFLWQLAFAATAIPVIVEIEPNNNPKQALEFSAPAILSGSMSGSDQDAYLWRISDADALKRWDMTLHGIPKALTGVSIVRGQIWSRPE